MTPEEIKEFLTRTCVPYLGADDGYWLDAERNSHEISKMDNNYLIRARNTLMRSKGNISNGSFLHNMSYDTKHRQDIIAFAVNAYESKLAELNAALN